MYANSNPESELHSRNRVKTWGYAVPWLFRSAHTQLFNIIKKKRFMYLYMVIKNARVHTHLPTKFRLYASMDQIVDSKFSYCVPVFFFRFQFSLSISPNLNHSYKCVENGAVEKLILWMVQKRNHVNRIAKCVSDIWLCKSKEKKLWKQSSYVIARISFYCAFMHIEMKMAVAMNENIPKLESTPTIYRGVEKRSFSGFINIYFDLMRHSIGFQWLSWH